MPMTAWVKHLLDWFKKNQRSMPWRDDPSPYRVWISEVMLQQTQVSTVIPYFERFLHEFPDVRTLAQAAPQAVLKRWEGLGYYSRARHLQKAARQIERDMDGRFPTSAAAWMQLPGIGEYTSAAIASIVFGEAIPAVDGNVLRVGARYLGIRENVKSPAVRKAIRAWLIKPLKTASPSSFNQAIMELGALVCRPGNPLCSDCPLYRNCAARRQELTHVIPFKPRPKTIPNYRETAAILHDGVGRYLLCQRPVNGLLGGMWEFPGTRCHGRTSLRDTLRRGIAEQTGLEVILIRKRGLIQHAFSHFSQTIHVFECKIVSGPPATSPAPGGPAQCWYTPAEIEALPLSKAHRAIAGKIA